MFDQILYRFDFCCHLLLVQHDFAEVIVCVSVDLVVVLFGRMYYLTYYLQKVFFLSYKKYEVSEIWLVEFVLYRVLQTGFFSS